MTERAADGSPEASEVSAPLDVKGRSSGHALGSAVQVSPCVAVFAPPMQALTPLSLVSVLGGGGGIATARGGGKGSLVGRGLASGSDWDLATTRPLPAPLFMLGAASRAAESRGQTSGQLPSSDGTLRLHRPSVLAAPVPSDRQQPALVDALPAALPVVADVPSVTDVPVAAPSPAAAAVLAAPAAVPGTPPASPPAARAAFGVKPELFRKAALDAHYGKDADLDALAQPKLGAWTVLVVLGSLVALLFIGAALSTIEVTVKAPGALRAPNGLRSVESVLSGAVTEVLAHAGDDVELGQVVARLEETKLRSTLTLREKELEVLRDDTLEAARADQALLQSATRALRRQRAALERRGVITQAQLRQRTAHLQNLRELVRHGAASGEDELNANESAQAASDSVALLSSQVAQLELSMADRTREWQQRDLERRTSLVRAKAAVEEAKSLLELVDIRAPAAGRIESLLATPGAFVQAGDILAQVVPRDAPRSIVAFLPSRETAFIQLGSDAYVEVESLPINEFGMARARVARISADVAKAEEIQAAFGEALSGSFVRVELVLTSDETHDKMVPHLRSGERVLVRLHRRQRRIISLLFEFVRKWLGQ